MNQVNFKFKNSFLQQNDKKLALFLKEAKEKKQEMGKEERDWVG